MKYKVVLAVEFSFISNAPLSQATRMRWGIEHQEYRYSGLVQSGVDRGLGAVLARGLAPTPNVRLWLQADIPRAAHNVRFAPNCGHSRRTRRMSASDPERSSGLM